MAYFRCNVCDGVMDETEATTFHREIHYELENKPTEWISELHCIYCGADEQYLEEFSERIVKDEGLFGRAVSHPGDAIQTPCGR